MLTEELLLLITCPFFSKKQELVLNYGGNLRKIEIYRNQMLRKPTFMNYYFPKSLISLNYVKGLHVYLQIFNLHVIEAIPAIPLS